MPASQIIAFSNMAPGGGQNNGVTRAVVPLNTLNVDGLSQEEFTELPVREPGVFDRGYVRIESNTLNGDSSLNVRKSRADTAIAVAVPAGTPGTYEDLINSVTFAAADELNWKSVTGGSSGLMNAKVLGLRFVPTDQDVTVCWAYAGGSGGGILANNVTRFLPISGTISVDTNANNAYGRINGAFTARNLCFQVASNPRTTDVTVRTWINGAFGNQIVTIPGGATGVFEDTTHSDTLAAGDLYCYAITTLGGGGNINTRRVSSTLVSASRQWLYSAANVNGATFTVVGGASVYVPFAGNLAQAVTIEADAQVRHFAHTVSTIAAYVSANNCSTTVTVRVRIDGVDGTIALPFSPGQTGLVENLIASDSIPEDALCNLEIKLPNGTGNITFRSITLVGATAAPSTPVMRSRGLTGGLGLMCGGIP